MQKLLQSQIVFFYFNVRQFSLPSGAGNLIHVMVIVALQKLEKVDYRQMTKVKFTNVKLLSVFIEMYSFYFLENKVFQLYLNKLLFLLQRKNPKNVKRKLLKRQEKLLQSQTVFFYFNVRQFLLPSCAGIMIQIDGRAKYKWRENE